MPSNLSDPDFAILHPAARHVEYGRRQSGQAMREAIKPYVDDLSSQGMRRLRAWFTDDFGTLPPNPLADRVLSAIGYHHPTGWCGTVVLTMEEDRHGDFPALTDDIRATLSEIQT